MSPETLPEGTDTILDSDDVEIDTSGAAPMDSGAAIDATAAGAPEGEPGPVAPESNGSGDSDAGSSTSAGARETFQSAKQQAGEKAQGLKDQATDKLRAYAVGGKDKATETIQGFARMIDDAANQIDDKVGGQYGDHARRAAQTLAGLASTIEEKDVDELFDQARDAVRKSPGIALGAAAALGFVLARVVKAGASDVTVEKDVAFTPDPSLGGAGTKA